MLVLAKFAKDKPAVLGAVIVLAVVDRRHPRPAAGTLSRRRVGLASAAAPEAAELGASLRHRQPRPRHLLARHPRHARRADDRADGGRHLHGDRRAARADRRLLPGLAVGGDHARHRRLPGRAAADPGAGAGPADGAEPAERHAGADLDLLAVLHAHRLRRGAAPVGLALHRRAAVHRRAAARASSSCTSCPTASRPSSCAPPSAWASRSWSPPCWASSAWAPRRPIRTGASPSPRAAQYLPDAWWFSTFPGLAIFLTVLGFNLLGDGLRDIVDPRLRRSR